MESSGQRLDFLSLGNSWSVRLDMILRSFPNDPDLEMKEFANWSLLFFLAFSWLHVRTRLLKDHDPRHARHRGAVSFDSCNIQVSSCG